MKIHQILSVQQQQIGYDNSATAKEMKLNYANIVQKDILVSLCYHFHALAHFLCTALMTVHQIMEVNNLRC